MPGRVVQQVLRTSAILAVHDSAAAAEVIAPKDTGLMQIAAAAVSRNRERLAVCWPSRRFLLSALVPNEVIHTHGSRALHGLRSSLDERHPARRFLVTCAESRSQYSRYVDTVQYCWIVASRKSLCPCLHSSASRNRQVASRRKSPAWSSCRITRRLL